MTENNVSDPLSSEKIIYITDTKPDWTDESVRELLKLYDEKIDMHDTGIISTQKKIWELVSKEMIKKQHFFSPAQCDNKWKTLKRTYKARQERIERFGSCKRPCPFESEIAEILNKRPQETWPRLTAVQPSSKLVKAESSNDNDLFNINLNNPPGFSGEDENSNPMGGTDAYVLQESGPLVEEIAQLRDSVAKNNQIQTQFLRQSIELQQKILIHLDNTAQRETNSLKLKQARIEQQNEIIKQMHLQNSLLQKLLDKIG